MNRVHRERCLRLLHICRLKPADLERCGGRPAYEEGPDSDAALAAIAEGITREERGELEQLRLDSGARYGTDGQLLTR